VVDETPPAVDLDNRDPFPIFRLEPVVAVDGDLAQLEAELVARGADDTTSRLAEVAAGGRVEDDLGHESEGTPGMAGLTAGASGET
jgi:hypothetical protein